MEINEFNQEKLRLLDTEQLLAFYGIFGRVSSPKAEAMVKGITRELKRRNYTLGEENLNEVDVKALMKGLVKGTTVAGKSLAKAIKVGYPIAKDMVKATWMTSKKIGGAIGDLMDDPEFRKLFTKYVDNPNDKNRTKKIQAYADGMLSDAPISGFESVTVKEERLKKVCSLVLGEDFDQDFIYEDVDFTKPSAIKDGYKSFALKEKVNENRAIVHNPKGIKWFIKQAEKKFPQYKGEIEQLEDDEIIFPNDPKLIDFFKGAREVKFVLKDSVDLEEASAKDLDAENLKQMIKNPDPKMVKSYGGSKYVQMLKKKLAKLESSNLKEETFDMFFDGYESDWYYLKQDAKKMRAKLTNVETQFGDEYYFTMDTTKSNLKKLLKKYNQFIFEEYVGGQEIQVAVINGKPLGAIELVPKRLFYDYKAKYTKSAKTKHIMPAHLSKTSYNEVLKIAKKAHLVLGCKGITRSDFKYYNNNFNLLEINTQPGMTNLSLVPEIASFKGLSFENLVEKILLDASINR